MSRKNLRKILTTLLAVLVLLNGNPTLAEGETSGAPQVAAEDSTGQSAEPSAPQAQPSPASSGRAGEGAPAGDGGAEPTQEASTDAPSAEASASQSPAEGGAQSPSPSPDGSPAASEAPTEGASEAPTAAPTESATTAPVQSASAAPEADLAPQATEPTFVFSPGYVQLRADSVLEWEDGRERELDTGAIAYALAYDEDEERLRIAFHDVEEADQAWIDLERTRPLSAEEVEDYLEDWAEGRFEEALVWEDLVLCPLKFKPEETEQTEVSVNSTEVASVAPAASAAPTPAPSPEAEATVAPTADANGNLGAQASLAPNAQPLPDMDVAVDATLAPATDEAADEPAPSAAPTGAASAGAGEIEMEVMEVALDATLPPEGAAAGAQLDAATAVEPAGAALAGEAVGLTRALLLSGVEQSQNLPKSEIRLPEFSIDYASEQLVFSEPLTAGELRFYRAGEAEAFLSVPCEAGLAALNLSELGAPQAQAMQLEVELWMNGLSVERRALDVAARPAYAAEAAVQASVGYSTALLSGEGEYALSAVDAQSPEIFAADGHNFSRLMDGTVYAIWARNPAAAGVFASGWTKLEGQTIETLVGIGASASFSADALVVEAGADWSGAPAVVDLAQIHFFSDGICVDAEVGGNFRYIWLNEAGEVLQEPPREAGSYRIQLETYGEAEKYVLRDGGELRYTISPVAAPEIQWPSASELTYGQKLSESALTGGSTELGSFAWASGDAVPAAGDASFELVFVPNDSHNYVWDEGALRASVRVYVRRRSAAVYAGNFRKTVGASDPSFTASTEGVLSGERLNYSLRRESGEQPGTYAISVVLGENPNYDVRTSAGRLTIERKSINASTVTVSAIPRQVYTGIEIEPKPVVRDGGVRLSEGTDYRLSYNGNRRVGVGTVTIEGIGDYTGSRDESFTIYSLSSAGMVSSNNSEVEEEEGLLGDENYGADGSAWDESGFPFLYESERLGDALYDGYLGTGDGLNQLAVVLDGERAPVDYEAVAIAAPQPDEELAYAASPAGTMLIYAGPDADGEPSSRTLRLSGAQLARIYLEGEMGTLLFRNCDAALLLDVYEMLSGDVARLAGLMFAGSADGSSAIEELGLDEMEDYPLAAEELFDMQFELRSVPSWTEEGEIAYELSVWLICGEEEIEISSLLPMLCVCANVEGLYEAGEEEAFLERFANALAVDGAAEALEGDLIALPEDAADGEADVADVYMVQISSNVGEPQTVELAGIELSVYRSAHLVSPWAGPGAYILLEREAED